jgi:hypothetical protein
MAIIAILKKKYSSMAVSPEGIEVDESQWNCIVFFHEDLGAIRGDSR